jgi:hypothetical protein
MKHDNVLLKKETIFFGKGMIALLIVIVALIAIFLIVSTLGSSPGPGTVVPAQKCAENTVAYANNNLVQPGSLVTLVSVNDTKGIYEIKVNYLSKVLSLYVTKDCTLLFPSVLNMNAAQATPTPAPEPKKTARPAVDLFVMAFCPYGTQAETVMRPVNDLLGKKADIRIRYITTITGTSIDSVNSLHGPSEAREDAYQICIFKSQPEKYWEYIRLFNEQCYPRWQDPAILDTCRKNVTATLIIDRTVTETCAAGADAISLLKADQTDSDTLGASASPTLVINGVKYSGARTPEAYKQAICNSFENAPAECSTTLPSASATGTTGNC